MSKKAQTIYIADNAADSVETRVKSVLERIGGIKQWISPGAKILIKPNFVAPFRKAITDFDVIRAVVKEIKSVGGIPIIAESSGAEFDTELTFRLLGAYDLAKELDVEIVNLDKSSFRRIVIRNGLIRNYDISEIAFSVEAIINLPRLKKHSQTDITCGMKNLFGLLGRETRAKIHVVNLDKGIVELNRIIKPVLTIVDASAVLERAVFGRVKEGRLKEVDAIIAGQDVLTVDRFCCELIGIEPDSIGHISIASQNRTGGLEFDTINYSKRHFHELRPAQFTLKKKMHRLVYRVVFALEIILSHLIATGSIIPYFHYYLGIRPKINSSLCNQCGDCAEVCPIDAIDLKKKQILRDCMQVRCLRCYVKCNLNAIELIGRKSLEIPVEETGDN